MTARSVYVPAFPGACFGLTGAGRDAGSGRGCLIRTAAGDEGRGDDGPGDPAGRRGAARRVTTGCAEHAALSALFAAASICNNASAPGADGEAPAGQPTEVALLVGAAKAGVPDPRPMYHRLEEVPFSSDRKRMEVRCRPVGGAHTCAAFALAARCRDGPPGAPADGSLYFVKGMPESVLGECASHTAPDGSAAPLDERSRALALDRSRRMAAGGLRVLACAYGPRPGSLVLAGFAGLEDPPREGVAGSVARLEAGGTRVVMVTGDARGTALAVARRCGILGGPPPGPPPPRAESSSEEERLDLDVTNDISVCPHDNDYDDAEAGAEQHALSGAQLDAIGQRNLADSIVGVKVFYRVAPRHKLALVRAFQERGEVVAMTGDGVNDATALKVRMESVHFKTFCRG